MAEFGQVPPFPKKDGVLGLAQPMHCGSPIRCSHAVFANEGCRFNKVEFPRDCDVGYVLRCDTHQGTIMCRLVSSVIAVFVLLGASALPARSIRNQDVAKTQIVAFMNALGKGDRKAFEKITTVDFRAFENGKIITNRRTFFDSVQTAIRAGMKPEMYQTDERSTIGDNVAAINYVNHGSYSTPSGMKDITWLEIVTLRRNGGEWQIDFIDSQVLIDTSEGAARGK